MMAIQLKFKKSNESIYIKRYYVFLKCFCMEICYNIQVIFFFFFFFEELYSTKKKKTSFCKKKKKTILQKKMKVKLYKQIILYEIFNAFRNSSKQLILPI